MMSIGAMDRHGSASFFFSFSLFTGLWLSAGGALAASLPEMQTHFDGKQFEQAYQTGVALEAELGGDPQFDLLYGLAALESGHLDRAAFAFERVLLAEPANHRARLELARTHYFLGDDVAAQGEFDAVLKTEPPANVKKNIQHFLDLIAQRQRNTQHKVSASVALDAGYDTNINSSTSDETFGPFTLSEDSVAQEDNFYDVDATFNYTYLFSKKTALFTEIGVLSHDNADSNTFDTMTYSFKVGPTFVDTAYQLRIPVQHQYFSLDGEKYRQLTSLGLEYSRLLAVGSYLLGFAQAGVMTYPDYKLRDNKFAVGGLGYSKKWRATTTTFSAYGGRENTDEKEGEFNARDYYGARLRFDYDLTNAHKLYVGAAAMTSRYQDEYPIFGEKRSDEFYQLSLGWQWQIGVAWQITTEVEASENHSNIDLFDYEREVVRLSVKYQM